ncbi:hypothetical protein DV735_g2934, partial [Chaetothyriales sp. CBS 134920]
MPERSLTISAGWTGLISAYTYLQLAPNTSLRIIDASRTVGGVWSKEKVYEDLYAQIAHPLFEYSFYRMPAEGLSPDGFISGESSSRSFHLETGHADEFLGRTIHKYLTDFARDFDLNRRIQLETSVTKVERTYSGGWSLDVDNGPSLTCDKLIWAVGGTSSPIIPRWEQKNFRSPIVHSSQIGNDIAAIEKIKTAVVVGAAKSGLDTVYMLLKAGKKVDWLIREGGAGPLAMAAPSFFGIWNVIDVIATRSVAAFSPSIMNTTGLWYNAINQTAIGYSANENFEKLRPEPRGFGLFWAKAGLGAASAPDFWKTMHEGDLTVHRDEIKSLSDKDAVHLASGATIHTDMILACSGYEKPYRSFNTALQIDLGLAKGQGKADIHKWARLEAQGEEEVDRLLPILAEFSPEASGVESTPHPDNLLHGPNRHYRRLIPPTAVAQQDRTIFFPGMVHSIFTPLIVETQALWGVAYLLGHLDLPSEDEMNQEIATFNAWTRKRYLAQGRKHAYAIFDFLSYIDVLCRDLGIKTARKSNWFSELFVRYKPSDYHGMYGEIRTPSAPICLNTGPPGPILKFLAYQLAEIFRSLLPDHFKYEFFEGEHEYAAAEGCADIFPGPYYAFYPVPTAIDVELAHQYVAEIMEDEGPFDAVMGFSQGAALAASILLRHEKEKPLEASPFRFAVFICGSLPYWFEDTQGVDVAGLFLAPSETGYGPCVRLTYQPWKDDGSAEAKPMAQTRSMTRTPGDAAAQIAAFSQGFNMAHLDDEGFLLGRDEPEEKQLKATTQGLLPSLSRPVRTLYQAAPYTFLENLAVRRNGSILTTRLDNGHLLELDPYSGQPPQTVHVFSDYLAVGGIVETEPDLFAVVAGNFSVLELTSYPGTYALADIPEASFLDGMTYSPLAHAVYLGDAIGGVIYKLDIHTGQYHVASRDPLLRKCHPTDFSGINGFKHLNSHLFWTNSGCGYFAKLPLDSHGDPVGNASLILSNQTLWLDDFAFAPDGSGLAYVSASFINQIISINQRGETAHVAGGLNSSDVAQPTAVAIGRTLQDLRRGTIYVTTAGAIGDPINGTTVVGAQLVAIDTKVWTSE